MNQIKHIVYTSDLDLHSYLPDFKGESIPALDPRSAVYIGTGIAAQNKETVVVLLKSGNTSRSVYSGMDNCLEGALSNVLGASLAKKRRRYIGVVTEDEFLHDMNALGNINVNDSLVYFVICDQNNEMICDYAKSLGFNTTSIDVDGITKEDIKKIVDNKKKSLVIVYGE